MHGADDTDDLAWVRPDRRLDTPVYRQVYERIRDAILSGSLPPGARLPSSRSLASQLATARGTVALAYDVLAGEGYILGRGAAGTIVDPALDRRLARGSNPARPAAPARRHAPTTGLVRTGRLRALQPGIPALDAFPRKLWSRLATRRARGLTPPTMIYQDAAGYAPLRQAIARYVAIARGVGCSADQVFITAGYQGALGLLARMLLRPGDGAWIENPGYIKAREALVEVGARLVPVPVDQDGLDVDAGVAASPAARLALVTPSHQSPLGCVLSLPRRLALLAWAARAGAWIVEDDYNSEFRYHSRPLPALKSLDDAGRVLYVGTFSKVLLPSLRLGYLVVPPAEVERFERVVSSLAPSAALRDQMIVADFIDQGHFARHIRRMRALYAERSAAFAAAIRDTFEDRLDLSPEEGGLGMVARLDAAVDDVALAERTDDAGFGVVPLSPWTLDAPGERGLIIGFANVAAEAAARETRRFSQALGRF